MSADLHIHTDASDGFETPAQVVYLAKTAGLKAIAVTDHETTSGIAPALEAGRRLSLEVLPGVEMSTEHKGSEVHLLGYLMDYTNPVFLSFLELLKQKRKERVGRIAARLCDLGVQITLDQILAAAGKGSVGRPHVARVLIKSGLVQSIAQAFEQYLGTGRPAYVPRFKYSTSEAIQLIRKAGGVTVLAHPVIDNSEDFIPEFVKDGLQGLEVYYPGHGPETISRFLKTCRLYNLVSTGGSDFHGGQAGHGYIGEVTVPYQSVVNLKKCAG
ncbi:MAG: PHP domain protein [Desulfotomaculum sp. 46_296]|nr:MAG: PHP domain protein [Desulfotomaculum sp. 46_296]